MPVTHTIRGSLLRLDLVGRYETEEIIREFRDAIADPACPPRVALLVDVSASTSLEERSPDQVRYLAEALEPHADRIGGKCAVVAVRDVHFGLSRMGAAFSAEVGVEAEVFRDERAALDWLHATTGSGPSQGAGSGR